MDKSQLIAQYEELTGKKNGKFMSEEKLINEIASFTDKKEEVAIPVNKSWDEMTEAERIEEAKKINSEQHKLMPEDIVPVFVNGEPHAIINNKYVPWSEAMIIKAEHDLQKAQQKLASLKATV